MAEKGSETTEAGNDRLSEKTIVEGNPCLPPYKQPSGMKFVCVSGKGPLEDIPPS